MAPGGAEASAEVKKANVTKVSGKSRPLFEVAADVRKGLLGGLNQLERHLDQIDRSRSLAKGAVIRTGERQVRTSRPREERWGAL